MSKQQRAERTRQTLILAAAEVFDRDGFAPSSLTAISTRAGVSNGALHFHFVSKNALAEAVGEHAMTSLRQIAPPREAGHGRALQVLVDTTHALAFRLGDDVVLRAGFGLSSDATWKGPTDLRQYWVDWVGEVLAGAAAEGALAEGVAVEDAKAVIAATTVGFEAMGRSQPRWSSRQMFGKFWRLLLPRLARADALGSLRPDGSPGLAAALPL
ncbi:ScbR family autoregulator-binding transcription factor [Streptomyces sp. NPDC051597]|uniref:ScbR family autoregulator-binding transcription factor n=1 Tax=Streptomyces sp. NPDC051597 TaxID=3155049 RepID=UPI003447DA16